MPKFLLACALLLSALFLPSTAQAAECTELSAFPVTIGYSGSYCLADDITTTLASGNLITIDANDVTIDCRGMRLENTQTNPNANVYAIWFYSRKGIRVIDCNIVGGWTAGIYAYQNNGLQNYSRDLEFRGNTVRGAYWFGIFAYGTGIDIRDNHVYDIGGRGSFAMGIRVGGSTVAGQRNEFLVRDNVIRGVASPVNYGYGIYANNADASSFTGNTISATQGGETFYGYGIRIAQGGNNRITGNQINGAGDGYAVGINAPSVDACYDNHIRTDYKTMYCDAALGNF